MRTIAAIVVLLSVASLVLARPEQAPKPRQAPPVKTELTVVKMKFIHCGCGDGEKCTCVKGKSCQGKNCRCKAECKCKKKKPIRKVKKKATVQRSRSMPFMQAMPAQSFRSIGGGGGC